MDENTVKNIEVVRQDIADEVVEKIVQKIAKQVDIVKIKVEESKRVSDLLYHISSLTTKIRQLEYAKKVLEEQLKTVEAVGPFKVFFLSKEKLDYLKFILENFDIENDKDREIITFKAKKYIIPERFIYLDSVYELPENLRERYKIKLVIEVFLGYDEYDEDEWINIEDNNALENYRRDVVDEEIRSIEKRITKTVLRHPNVSEKGQVCIGDLDLPKYGDFEGLIEFIYRLWNMLYTINLDSAYYKPKALIDITEREKPIAESLSKSVVIV